MIEGHYERLMHGGMALEQSLDLNRKDIFAAAHEHVVIASDEIIETFFIAPADVARVVPAVTQAVSRFSRQVVITEQHAGVLHGKFTFIVLRLRAIALALRRIVSANKLRFGSGIWHTNRAGRTRLAFRMRAE